MINQYLQPAKDYNDALIDFIKKSVNTIEDKNDAISIINFTFKAWLAFTQSIPPCNECGGIGFLALDDDSNYAICCNEQCIFITEFYEDKIEALDAWTNLTPTSEREY